jgi:hypothetical protein
MHRMRLRSSSFTLRPADVIRRQKSDSSFHTQFTGSRIGQENARRPSYESKTMARPPKSRLSTSTCQDDNSTSLPAPYMTDMHGNSSHDSASEDEEPPVPISKHDGQPSEQKSSGFEGLFMRKATRSQSQSIHCKSATNTTRIVNTTRILTSIFASIPYGTEWSTTFKIY